MILRKMDAQYLADFCRTDPVSSRIYGRQMDSLDYFAETGLYSSNKTLRNMATLARVAADRLWTFTGCNFTVNQIYKAADILRRDYEYSRADILRDTGRKVVDCLVKCEG